LPFETFEVTSAPRRPHASDAKPRSKPGVIGSRSLTIQDGANELESQADPERHRRLFMVALQQEP
jgi:hypothetical protein